MGIFSFLSPKTQGEPAKKAALSSADLVGLFSGSETSSGVTVTPDSAIKYPTVWACVALLADSIAQLPCHVYTKNKNGSKSRVHDTALSVLLSRGPNFFQSTFDYTSFMVTALAMRGNHYAFVSKTPSGEVLEIIPFAPQSVEMKREGFKNIRYEVSQDGGGKEIYPLEKMTHVRGLSLDGFIGVSPITYHMETIGLSKAAERYGARLFKNGARPSGIIKHPSELSEPAYERIRKYWQEMYGGSNVGKTAILEEGADYETISMSNEDAQYLDVRQFQRTEICSIYRIPPHMIGDLTKSSFSNITQQSLEFVKYTILPWCRRIELTMMRDLLSEKDHKKGMFVEFLVDGLERADIKTRYDAYKAGIDGGFLSANEVRRKENMNPREGGDIYLAPLNMVDSTQMPAPTTEPTKPKQLKSYQTKGVEVREQIREEYKGRFQKLAALVVTQEVKAIKKMLQNDRDFLKQVEKFYPDFAKKITANFKGLIREFGGSVKAAALKEHDPEASVDPQEVGVFLDAVAASFAQRYTGSSSGQLKKLVEDTEPSELKFAIDVRLDEWETKRPAKVAEREVVQQESAVSRFVWAAAGVTLLQWVNRGSKSCPYCTSLDGKVVGIGAPFVEKGEFKPKGYEKSPMKVRGPKVHAPIHQGCLCAIVPVAGS